MKTLKFFLYFLLPYISYSQTNCDHNVSTNYLNPINNVLPVGSSSEFLNGFNWFPVDENGLYMDYPCTNISFGGVDYTEMNNILFSGLSYYDYLNDGPLPLGENGWELLLVNLGRYPDDVTPITNGNYLNFLPYIVIYNRYTGTLRVFVNYGLDHTIGNGAEEFVIELSFRSSDQVSGMFRLYQSHDQALDEKSDVILLKSICKAPAMGRHWASADYKIAYDPCTCFFPSKLVLNIGLLSSSEIELYGRNSDKEGDLLVENSMFINQPLSFLSGFDYTRNVAEGGVVMHKSIQTMIDDYLSKYDQHNKELIERNEHNVNVKRNLAILKMGEFVINLFANALPGEILSKELVAVRAQEFSATEHLNETPQEIYENYYGLGSLEQGGWYNVVKQMQNDIISVNDEDSKMVNFDVLFRTLTRILGEQGNTFIQGNFVEDIPSKKTAIPTASFSDMYFTGQLTDFFNINGPEFYTPGTYGSIGTGTPNLTNVYEYPVYNEVLGTFALLKSPKIKLSKTVPIEGQKNWVTQNTVTSNTGSYKVQLYRHQLWAKEYQIQLAEDLQYAINSSLDVKNYTVEASFNIVAKPKSLGKPTNMLVNAFQDPVSNVNITSNNTEIQNYTPIITNNRSYLYYATPSYSEEILNEELNRNMESKVHDSIVSLQTPYLPIDAFQPLVTGIGIQNEAASYYENFFWEYDIDKYAHTKDSYGNYTWNLNDPDLIKPVAASTQTEGFEYDFDIELKLIVNIEFNTINSEGKTNKVTQLLTYKIAPENITWLFNDIIHDLGSTTNNIGQYKENINFDDVDFHGQSVEGCQLVGNTYTCQAWNNIIIEGNLSTSNNFNVNILAGNEIVQKNESIVSPEIVLAIKPILDFSHPMPKADANFVANFCSGNNGQAPLYAANQASSKILVISDSNQGNDDQLIIQDNKWDFELFPNPSHKFSKIKINHVNALTVDIKCRDITGKEVAISWINTDKHEFEIDLQSLKQGVYFIQVSKYGESKTKQLIVL